MIFLAIPVIFFELSLGQFCSQGILTCWRCVPVFKGLGFAMGLLNFYVGIYYNMLIAYCIYYLFASFTSKLPWSECDNEYNTGGCGINNSPAEEYYTRSLLGNHLGYGLNDLGSIQWKILLCYLVAFVFCAGCLSIGVKLFGKLVWLLVPLPLLILVILLIRGSTLPGATHGIQYFILEDLTKLGNARVWFDAASSVLYSVSIGFGGWITLGSYNRFNTNPMYISIIVVLTFGLTSLIAGFMMFSFLGFAAHTQNVAMDYVVTSGPGLVFIAMADAISHIPVAPLWSILFYVMLICFGITSQLVLIETVVTGVTDQLPVLRPKRPIVVALYCLLMFLLGLPMTTQGGMDFLSWIDTFAAAFSIYLICGVELLAVMVIYGFNRFLSDIECMIGKNVFCCIPWGIVKYLWLIMWMVILPLACLAMFIITIHNIVMDSWLVFDETWANVLGWMMSVSVIVIVLVVGFLVVLLQLLSKRNLSDLFRPTKDWGPILEQDRQTVNVSNPYMRTDFSQPVGFQNVQVQMPYYYGPTNSEKQPVIEQVGEKSSYTEQVSEKPPHAEHAKM